MDTLLQRLKDDNPSNQDELSHGENNGDDLTNDIILLLSSRPRSYHIDHINLINESILNYGVSDFFSKETQRQERNDIMRNRIHVALTRFETRLRNVVVYPGQCLNGVNSFLIEANTINGAVRYHLIWDDVISQFSLRD